MRVYKCTEKESDLLAELNKQLIEDEHSTNEMSVKELKERMEGFLSTSYQAYLFYEKETVIGYALVNMEKEPYYLRQFFIVRTERRKGYGKKAFLLLIKELGVQSIDLEVLSANGNGRAFWRSCGFTEYSTYMKLARKE